MLRQRQGVLFLFIGILSLSLLCDGAPNYVYRGASRSPAEIQRVGGFFPKGRDSSLYNHAKGTYGATSRDDDGYVSTSTSESVARTFRHSNRDAYVYKIHVTPNMIDTVGTLGKYSDYDEELEYAALGGINFDQIVSWKPLRNRRLGKSEMNKDFNARKYRSAVAGGIDYRLAGFPPGHQAWREEPWKNYKPT